jgi:hypothetical protein
MANMSYCAFENTYADVVQCIDLMREEVEEGEKLSPREWDYAQDLVKKLRKLQSLVDEAAELRMQASSPDGVRR